MNTKKTAFIFAHPDDETFLCSIYIRQKADRGEEAVELLATRGDAGGRNGYAAHLSREELGALREKEMEVAAGIIGLSSVEHLGIPDGELKDADETATVERIIEFMNRHRPQEVVTFPPDGINGHPDHVAISRLTRNAVLSGRCPSVESLHYCLVLARAAEGTVPDILLDTEDGWATKQQALKAHQTQWMSIERHFGEGAPFSERWRYESFVLAWTSEKGYLL